MKTRNEKNKFLNELQDLPIVSAVCKRTGISKTTVYRWLKNDDKFSKKFYEALNVGRDTMSDIARGTIIKSMQKGSLRAAEYWLDTDGKRRFKHEDENSQEVKPVGNNLKIFKDKPIAMHEIFPSGEVMKWPSAIRSVYAKIWSGKYQRVIIKAPRGGGKSKLLGTIGFDLWFLRNRKVVNMGGSAVQAQIVYKYFTGYCEIDPSVENYVKGRPKISETISVDGNYFSSVTASTKQVRGPHPDVLISDETCESDDDLIHAALPMVDTSKNPLIIMASTFHKIFGIFQETWDNAEERGYLRIQWDVFDITKEFSPSFWKDPEVSSIPGIEKLVALTKGRTGDPEGWVPVENIVQAWKEKPTEDWFEIEYMGSRPSSAGLVLKPEDIDRALFDSDVVRNFDYIQGAEVVIGIDWGFSSMTAVTEFMRHQDGVVVMLDSKNYSQVASEQIVLDVVSKVKAHGIRFIYADSAGKFENVTLKNELAKNNIGCVVVEVVFGTEKEGMLGNLRGFFERGKIRLPKKFKEAYWQFKRYRYQEGTDKPIKKDDHIPDSTMCALQHFKPGNISRPFSNPSEAGNGGDKPLTAGLLDKKF